MNFKPNKKNVLFIALGFLSVASLVYLYLNTQKTPPSVPSSINTTPTPPNPTPQEFKLISIYPSSGSQPLAIPDLAIALFFSQETAAHQVSITITPKINLEARVDEKDSRIIYISPKSNWKLNQKYTINVVAKSNSGLSLKEPIIHSFTFLPFPTNMPDVF
ncbi:MAG: hypothetical protein G01um101416_1114 [Microgenomates group bacterium Gr01-1014_16]|nr:MAG: hypothetical protein G01um101416_1114 [Microgenomates group bacterium Gr01-1014_16]